MATFLGNLSKELEKRLLAAGKMGRTTTLKLMVKSVTYVRALVAKFRLLHNYNFVGAIRECAKGDAEIYGTWRLRLYDSFEDFASGDIQMSRRLQDCKATFR